MKKIITFGICLCLMLVFFVGYQNGDKHVIDSAKLLEFKSAEEVVNNSELIVKVTKISEKPIAFDLGNGHYDNLTLSDVEIEKVIKPMQGKEINRGDVITIVESEWTDPNTKIIHHLENYSKMKEGKKYTLYLGYNIDYDNYYPVGLLYGKVPVDTSEKNFYGDFKDSISRVLSNNCNRINKYAYEYSTKAA